VTGVDKIMSLSELVHDLADVLYTPGAACDYGCAPKAIKHWIEFAKALGTGKRIVAVADWMWWDLVFSPEHHEIYQMHFTNSGLQPVYLKADNILLDTSGRFQPGCWVRTTLLQRLHRNCVFETRNSLYILVGPGTRKSVAIDVAHQFF